ncbi:gamma-glutamylcyclotransferase family protein [Mucilaginibacter terrae]|uniref:gamma-glutamylcyclotransferase family protein n=1 Tax=Mucilaginibacter terrae TaxID=1955052 RepID=UPI0036308A08
MDYIFVYGTLLKHFENEVLKLLQYSLQLKVGGCIKGELYDLGQYPGFVEKAHNGQMVKGEIYHVLQPEKVFAILDEYEGEEYSRKKKLVRLDTHKNIRCWVYVYRQKPGPGHKKIISGDYLAYIRNKVNNG